jgi:hypothetical protein
MSLPTVQDKIFTEYMNLRAAVKKVDGFIPVRTTFIQMEEKFLLWRRELEQLQGDVQKKDVDETAAGNIVDKCIALLWWNLVRPPYSSPPLSPFSFLRADFQQTGIHNLPPQRTHPLRDLPNASPEILPFSPPPFMDSRRYWPPNRALPPNPRQPLIPRRPSSHPSRRI